MKAADIPAEIANATGAIKNMRMPIQGHTSAVAHISAAKGEFIVKRCSRQPFRDWLRKEHRHLLMLQPTGLPIPRVCGFFEEGEAGASWLLTSYMEGMRLREFLAQETNEAKRAKAIRSYGAMLRAIHSAAAPAALTDDGDWLTNILREAAFNLAHYEVDGSAELLAELDRARPEPIPAVLIHGDFTIDNVIVHEDTVVGAIDWGSAAFGDPRYDIALAIRPKTNAFEQAEDIRLFYEGYGLMQISEQQFNYFEGGVYAFF